MTTNKCLTIIFLFRIKLTFSASVEQFNVTKFEVNERLPDLPFNALNPLGCVTNNTIYVFGGQTVQLKDYEFKVWSRDSNK